MRSLLLACLILTCTAVTGLRAQVDPAPPAPSPTPQPAQPTKPEPAPAAAKPEDRVARAIADYELVKNAKDRAAEARHALLWLGEIDDPAVNQYLRAELKRAGGSALAATVLEAIGKVVRPTMKEDLRQVLEAKHMSPALRAAAASELLRLGDRAFDEVIEIASANDDAALPPVRDAAVTALIDSGIDRAWRSLAPLLLRDNEAEQIKLLRRTDKVQGCFPVDAARIKLVHDGTLLLASCAWRQLCAEGHARASDLTVDLLERVLDDPVPVVAADLVGGLAYVQDADFHPAMLRFGAIQGAVVRRALKTAAPVVAKNPGLIKFLLTKGLDDSRPAAREAAKLLLTEAPPEAVQPLVERIRADLRKKKKTALDAAVGLHEILARDPSWRADLAGMAASNDVETRLLGLSLLMEISAPGGIGPAQQSLGNKLWELRSLSLRYLTRCRDVSSIPFLIARFGKEDGRLAQELDAALFAHTGTRCWSKKEWEKWWSAHQQGFLLPNEASVRGGGGSTGGQTISYHDIPVVSTRLCFLVDRSGSMNAPMGTDKKFTRLEGAKEQLRLVVSALPDSHHVNLIVYETDVFPLWKELRPLNDDNRKLMLSAVSKIPIGRGTNIFDALEKAYEDPEVDTLYLLTDGQPTEGRIRDPDAIVDEVRRWTRRRQIVIHSIALGAESDLLRRLADVTGGSYKYVK